MQIDYENYNDSNYVFSCTNSIPFTTQVSTSGQAQDNPDINYIPLDYLNGLNDMKPDLFKFNFLNYNCDFILNWETGEYVSITDSNYKIESFETNPLNAPSSFQITAPDGHKFRFNIMESGKIDFINTKDKGIPQSQSKELVINNKDKSFRTYKISEIFTNQGDHIKFNYLSIPNFNDIPKINQSIYIYVKSEFSSSPPSQFDYWGDIISETVINQNITYLSSIEFNSGEINFIISDRIDNNNSKKLDRIELKDNDNNLVSYFDFNYSYFIGHNNGNQINNMIGVNSSIFQKSIIELSHRLKLNSITKNNDSPYVFYYNDVQLPLKTSLATDYWGFYNGKLENENLIPNIFRFNVPFSEFNLNNNTIDFFFNKIKNNNKSSNEYYSKARILDSIKYPTGGSTQFVHELNTFENYLSPDFAVNDSINSLNLNTQGLQSINGQILESVDGLILFNDSQFNGHAYLSIDGCNYSNSYEDAFIRITEYDYSLVELIGENPQMGVPLELEINGLIPDKDNQVSNVSVFNEYLKNQHLIQMEANGSNTIILNDLTFNFTKGVLLFQVFNGCEYSMTTPSMTSLTLNYFKQTDQDSISKGAGLRVKRIKDFNSNSIITHKKEYDYTGGKLMTPLTYFKKQDFSLHYLTIGGEFAHFYGNKFTLSNTNYLPYSRSALGNYVGYRKVEEKFISNLNNDKSYKIETIFSNNQDDWVSGPVIYGLLNIPPKPNPLKNGLIYAQKYFNKDGGLVKEINNNYEFSSPEECHYGVTLGLNISPINGDGAIHELATYPISNRKSFKTESVTYDYLDSNIVENKTEYFYNDIGLLAEEKKTIDNDTISTILLYPSDIMNFNPDTSYFSIFEKNYINFVVKKIIEKNGEIKSLNQKYYTIKDVYDDDDFLLGSRALEREISNNKDSSNEIINFNFEYDNYGNIKEISKNDGTSIIFIWGYNNNLPISKIINFSYENLNSSQLTAINSVKSLSDTDYDTCKGMFGCDEANLRDALNNLRQQFSDVQITTYTYDPLIGVTSITDPRGQINYYIYDDFNRLERIENNEGNIIEEYEYNYKN